MEEFVSCALPGTGSEKVTQLAQKLAKIGVLSFDDLKCVEEKDIRDILRPIQMKKFLDQCKKLKITPYVSPEKATTSTHCDTWLSVPTTSESLTVEDHVPIRNENIRVAKPHKNWAEDFEVPFDSFPKEIQASKKGQQSSKMSINAMVRTVVTHICNIDDTPGRKNLRIISAKMTVFYLLLGVLQILIQREEQKQEKKEKGNIIQLQNSLAKL